MCRFYIVDLQAFCFSSPIAIIYYNAQTQGDLQWLHFSSVAVCIYI